MKKEALEETIEHLEDHVLYSYSGRELKELMTLARKGLAAQYFVEAWDDAVKCSKPLYQTNDAFRRAYIKFHLDTTPRSGDEERKT